MMLSSLTQRSLWSVNFSRVATSQLCGCLQSASQAGFSRRFASKKIRKLQHDRARIKKRQALHAPVRVSLPIPPPPPREAPPLYVTSTSSPNAYVAISACEEFNVEPSSLFNEQEIPESFRHSQFEYCPPAKFPNQELPTYHIPEIALLGRSNVGKSSLVNAIMRHGLAHCSKTPGRTQTVNYFPMIPRSLFEKDWDPQIAHGFLVDLPGYGYAEAPQAVVQEWQAKTQDFLLARRDHGTLRRLFILIDARRGPTQIDRNIMGWMDDAGIDYSVVITKADRVSKAQIVKYANEVCMRYHTQLHAQDGHGGSQGPVVHVTSSKDGIGVQEMQFTIDAEFSGYYQSQKESGEDEGNEGYLQGDDYDDDDDEEEEDCEGEVVEYFDPYDNHPNASLVKNKDTTW